MAGEKGEGMEGSASLDLSLWPCCDTAVQRQKGFATLHQLSGASSQFYRHHSSCFFFFPVFMAYRSK